MTDDASRGPGANGRLRTRVVTATAAVAVAGAMLAVSLLYGHSDRTGPTPQLALAARGDAAGQLHDTSDAGRPPAATPGSSTGSALSTSAARSTGAADRSDGLGTQAAHGPTHGPQSALHPTVQIPADSTPAAAAAGLEPGSMAPLNGVPAGWSSSVHRFSSNRLARSYLVLRPTAKTPGRLPVVVVLHGRGLTPAGIERMTDLPEVTGPAILVFPAGYGRSWNAGGCCGQA
ncbi:MAG: hypothetical protein ACRDXE_01105, partial [Acidimicrobiales bacterium]